LADFFRRRDFRGFELEVNAVMGLEDKAIEGVDEAAIALGRPISGFELESSVVGVNGDGALRNPRKSLCEAAIETIKEDAAESKSICDCSISCKIRLDSFVPTPDSRMDFKPAIMESLCLFNSPASLDSRCTWRTAVVNTVNSVFAFLSLLSSCIAMLRELGEERAPHRLGVVDVDVDALAKSGLKVVVVGFPSYNLGVGALEVGLKHDVAGVRNKQLTDVGEGDVKGHSLLPRARGER
jgi:hypothetical protein